MATSDGIIWHQAYLVHEELLNMDFEQADIKKFIDCLNKIDNELE